MITRRFRMHPKPEVNLDPQKRKNLPEPDVFIRREKVPPASPSENEGLPLKLLAGGIYGQRQVNRRLRQREVARHRIRVSDCDRYLECLDYAAERYWLSWSCSRCSRFIKETP